VEAVTELRKRGISILIVEQNVALASEIADRGYVMSLGRVIYEIQEEKWKNIQVDDVLYKAYLGG
jgi:ABC-type branched-subunit amino acid transport system ATPase component